MSTPSAEPRGADASPPAWGELQPGQRVLDRYRIDYELDRGGVGIVFKGTELGSGHPVAIKTLLSNSTDPTFRVRFVREAEVQLNLRHPHIAQGLELGDLDDGRPVFVMEFVEGVSCYDAIFKHDISPRRSVVVARQALLGLEHAHHHGLVHRDLKPENIMLVPIGQAPRSHLHVKVIDFGLVTTFRDNPKGWDFARMTVSGFSVGTPGYMAPEQLVGGKVDPRTDLYAIGTMLFEMLARRLPFPYDAEERGWIRRVLTEPLPTLLRVRPGPWCTPEAEAFVRRALAPSPGDRFQTAVEMIEALEGVFCSFDELPADPPFLP